MATAIVIGVIAGATASAAFGAAVLTAVAIGMAAASITYALTAIPKPPGAQSPAEQKQLIRSSRAAKQVIYGTAKVSGVWLFGNEQAGDQEEGEKLYMAVGVAGHEISAIDNVWLGDRDIVDFNSNASYVLLNNPTTSYGWNPPQWSDDMIGKGTAWVALTLTYDRELYTSGIPVPKFLVRGKEVYDPRTGTTGHSDNAALVILDYLLTDMNIPLDRIILSGSGSLIAAANLCDESVANPDGSFSKRYTINGMFNQEEKIGDILNKMLTACGGALVRTNGMIGLLPAAYYGPSDFTITSSDITGSMAVSPEADLSEAVNTIKGSYVEPAEDYTEVDFPPVVDQTEYDRVGYEINDDMTFDFVQDVYQAQRVADISLRRRIAAGGVAITTNLRGMYCTIGRVITLSIPEIGIDGEYRVVKQSVSLSDGCELELAPDNVDIYNDAIGEPYVPPVIVELPVGGVPSPTSVQFVVEAIGDAVQGYLYWTQPSIYGNITSSEILVFDVNNVVVLSGVSYGDKFDLNALPLGNYTAKVRNVGVNNAVSSYTTTDVVIAEPPIPTSVTVRASNWNILLSPNVEGGVPSGTIFEFFHLEDTNNPLQNPPAYGESDFDLAGDAIGTGSSFNDGGLTPTRYQHYWIRSITSYGKSDFFYLETQTTAEEDLVTTVIERLVSVEIVSSDYVQGVRGYKIFGANDPANNGRAEFNNIVLGSDSDIDYSNVSGDKPPVDATNDDTAIVAQSTADQALVEAAAALAAADGSIDTFYQTSPPSASVSSIGDLWIDTNDDNSTYIYTNTGWVLIADNSARALAEQAINEADQAAVDAATAQSTADGKIRTFYQSSPPGSSTGRSIGDIWIDTNDGNNQYIYTSGGWVDIQDQAIVQANDAISNLYPDQSNLSIQSGNYQQGSAGWAIDKSGNAEFRNAVVRGDVEATSIKANSANIINTLMLQGQAVTFPESATTAGKKDWDDGIPACGGVFCPPPSGWTPPWNTGQSITVYAQQGNTPVSIAATMTCEVFVDAKNTTETETMYVKLAVNGSNKVNNLEVVSTTAVGTGSYITNSAISTFTFVTTATLDSGNNNIVMSFKYGTVSNRNIVVTQLKR